MKELISIYINYFVLLKEKWKVSVTAMIKRAQHLNLLTDNQARYLFAKISEKGYRKKEPLDDKIPYEKPYLIKQSIEYEKDFAFRHLLLRNFSQFERTKIPL